MARTIGFDQTLTANQIVAAQAAVQDSRYNPVERTSRVRLYASADGAGAGANVSLSLGSDSHGEDIPVQIGTLSIRDHLVTEGIARRGQKITVGVRETGGVATTTIHGRVVITPLGA